MIRKIGDSENLKQLEQLLEENSKKLKEIDFEIGKDSGYEEDKSVFDGKLARGRFAYIVKHKDRFEKVIT